MVNPKRFYTYAYLREDKTPYYIGKGNGRRITNRSKKDIKPPKDKSRIIFLKQNLTEQEAFKHEIYMIAVFGRKDLGTGILHNRTDGGEGKSGWVPSEETREKMSLAQKNPSKETRRKRGEKNKGNSYAKGNKIDRSIVEKLTAKKKLNRWWNNGMKEKFCRECPHGWKSGRLLVRAGNYPKYGKSNPNSKIWEITFINKNKIIVECLKTWCEENNYDYRKTYSVKHRNLQYKKIIKLVSISSAHIKK